MKVTRNTPTQLIVADTPWLIGIMLIFFIMAFVTPGVALATQGGEELWFGLLFAFLGGGMGVVAFCVFVRRVQIILDRTTGKILIRRQSVFGYMSRELELDGLRGADIETTTSHSDGRSRRLYRPVLVFDETSEEPRVPIVAAYSSGRGSKRLVEAVNDWLKSGGA